MPILPFCFKLRIPSTCKNVYRTHNDIHVLICICSCAYPTKYCCQRQWNFAASAKQIPEDTVNIYVSYKWCFTHLHIEKEQQNLFLFHGIGQMMFSKEAHSRNQYHSYPILGESVNWALHYFIVKYKSYNVLCLVWHQGF